MLAVLASMGGFIFGVRDPPFFPLLVLTLV